MINAAARLSAPVAIEPRHRKAIQQRAKPASYPATAIATIMSTSASRLRTNAEGVTRLKQRAIQMLHNVRYGSHLEPLRR